MTASGLYMAQYHIPNIIRVITQKMRSVLSRYTGTKARGGRWHLTPPSRGPAVRRADRHDRVVHVVGHAPVPEAAIVGGGDAPLHSPKESPFK